MVTVTPKQVPELEGCKSFGFKTKNRIQQSSRLNSESALQQRMQNFVITGIVVALQMLQNFPTEVSITVGARDGRSLLEGSADPYEGSAQTALGSVIEEITAEAYQFAQEFPGSDFSVTYTQTVKVTRVDR